MTVGAFRDRIEILQGDITRIQADAIVNAANSSLMGGGGVDGAIHRAGGPAILEECRKVVARQGGCRTGEAVITTAGRLPAKFVIHTVGPVWQGGGQEEEKKLGSCYTNSLRLAREHALNSIAFPNISTGIYRFPKDLAADISIRSVLQWMPSGQGPEKVFFVCFDKDNYDWMLHYINLNITL